MNKMKTVKVIQITRTIVANEIGADVLDSILCEQKNLLSATSTLLANAGVTLELYGCVHLLCVDSYIIAQCKEGYEGIETIILKNGKFTIAD